MCIIHGTVHVYVCVQCVYVNVLYARVCHEVCIFVVTYALCTCSIFVVFLVCVCIAEVNPLYSHVILYNYYDVCVYVLLRMCCVPLLSLLCCLCVCVCCWGKHHYTPMLFHIIMIRVCICAWVCVYHWVKGYTPLCLSYLIIIICHPQFCIIFCHIYYSEYWWTS